MKGAVILIVMLGASLAGAVTVHRSFRNGYPAGAQGVTVRQQPNAAEVTEFNALFEFTEDCGGCMCCGYPGIDWYRKGKRIALTAMQHGHSLRWKGFKSGSDKFGDCYYTDESKAKLEDWFKAHLPKLVEDPHCKDWLGPKAEKVK